MFKDISVTCAAATNLHVRQQMMLQREILLARLAMIRALLRVQQQMRVQAMLVRETLPAVHARVGLLAGVSPRMRSQVVFHQERLSTFFARVRPQLAGFVGGQLLLRGPLVFLRGGGGGLFGFGYGQGVFRRMAFLVEVFREDDGVRQIPAA